MLDATYLSAKAIKDQLTAIKQNSGDLGAIIAAVEPMTITFSNAAGTILVISDDAVARANAALVKADLDAQEVALNADFAAL